MAQIRTALLALAFCSGAWGQILSFSPAAGSPYALGVGATSPSTLAISDLNKDGFLDVIVSNSGGQSYSAYLGQSSSGRPTGALGSANQISFFFSPFDSNTTIDRAINVVAAKSPAGSPGNPPYIFGGSKAKRLRQGTPWNSSSFFTQIGYTDVSSLSTNYTYWAAAGDFNGDGIDDCAVTLVDSTTFLPTPTIEVIQGGSSGLSFLGATTLTMPVGLNAVRVALADLNGDGKADLVVTTGTNSVVVFLSTATTSVLSFAAPTTINLTANSQFITIADATGDGKNDLVIATGGSTVLVLPGNGDGTFGSAITLTIGSGNALSTAVADFTGDRLPDIAVATGDSVYIFAGTGSNTFGGATAVSIGGTNPVYVGAADLNSDSKPDLIIANGTDNNIEVQLNTSQVLIVSPASLDFNAALGGTNPPAQTVSAVYDTGGENPFFTTSVSPSSPWLLITPSSGVGSFSVSTDVTGLAAGVYTATITVSTGPSTSSRVAVTLRVAGPAGTLTKKGLTDGSLAMGDFNGDGKLDLIGQAGAGCPISNFCIFYYPGNGDGTFGAGVMSAFVGSLSGQFGAAADFNGDGKLDLAMVTSSSVVRILYGDGAGHFTLSLNSYATGTTPSGFVVSDFNNDGKPDLAISAYGSGPNGVITILLNDGTGAFNARNFIVGNQASSIVAGDFNKDGKVDLVVSIRAQGEVWFLPGSGDGYFGSQYVITAGSQPYSVTSGDYNNDGKLDIAVGYVGSPAGVIRIFLGDGAGAFAQAANSPITTNLAPIDLATGDFDGDGNLDLIFARGVLANFGVLRGDGAGNFPLPIVDFAINNQLSLAYFFLGDFNSDGKLDVVVPDGGFNLWLGGLASTTTALSSNPSGQAPQGQSTVFTATVTVASPNWTTASGVVTISDTIAGQLAQANASAGALSTTQTLSLANHSLSAAYAGDARTKPSNTTSNYAFNVFTAHLGFTTQPATTTAGQTLSSIVVKVLDPANAVVPYSTASVTLTLNGGTFSSGTTTVNAVAGVATFSNLKINTTGAYTITATSTGVTSADSNSFNINPGPLAQFLVNGFPNPTTSGVSHSFTVTAQDAGGNTVTGYTGTVAFTSSDPQAVLPSNYTFVTGDNGVHVFSATLKTAPSQSITAMDAGNNSITGSQVGIAVALAGPGSLTPSGTPQTAMIGTTYGTALSVVVKDGGGNPLSGQTVTFTAPTAGAKGTFPGSLSTATAVSDVNGLATAPAFTANTVSGSFAVTASINSLTTTFNLTNTPGVAANIAIVSGNSQTTAASTPFPSALAVKVTDSFNNPISGFAVPFTAPGSGAAATFPGSLATVSVNTDSLGVATAPALTANGAVGSYSVTAGTGGLTVSFSLGNVTGSPSVLTIVQGSPQSTTVNTAFATVFKVKVTDSATNPISGLTVSFTAPASGASGAFPGALTTVNGTTDSLGVATAPVFTAGTTAGSYAVTAAASSLNGTISLTNNAGPAAIMTITAGDNQSAVVAAAFTTALAVKVTDSFNNPLSGIAVTFAAPGSGASGAFSSASTVNTSASGIAVAPAFTANSTPGSYQATATAGALSQAFNLSNLTGPPASLTIVTGNAQSTVISTAFATSLSVRVADTQNNPLTNVAVTFAPPVSGASGAFSGPATVNTNASGIATAPAYTANTVAGVNGVRVSAGSLSQTFALTNLPGTPALIVPTGTPQTSVISQAYSTAFSVKITDASNNPIPGLSVTFTAPSSGALGTFPGPAASAAVTTDSSGRATAPTLTANATVGAFVVTAASGALTTTFNLTNVVIPTAGISVISGSGQTAALASPFGSPLVARVFDINNNPVANATVTFTMPAIGPSGSFGGGTPLSFTTTTNAQGLATTPTITANNTSGGFTGTAATGNFQTLFSLSVGKPPATTAEPSLLIFRYEIGGPLPAPQNVVVTNATNGLTFTADSPWIKASARSNSSANDTVQVSIDPANLAPGNYSGNLVVSEAIVRVSLQVLAHAQILPTQTSLTFQYTLGQPLPAEQLVYITAITRNFNITVTADSWLRVTPTTGATPAALHVNVAPDGLEAGVYQGAIHIAAPDASNSPFDIKVTLTVLAAPPKSPAITAVVNAASGMTGPVSGNEIVSLYGSNLACSVTPEVLIDGAPALILAQAGDQVNLVLPDLTGKTQIAVQFRCGAATSDPLTLNVAPQFPGIFSRGTNQVSAFNQDFILNSPEAPAARESVVMLFGTGFGALLGPNGSGLQWLPAMPVATIGGVPAEVTFAGAAPGLPGVTQINIRIPATAPTGAAVPLIVTGVQSALTISLN